MHVVGPLVADGLLVLAADSSIRLIRGIRALILAVTAVARATVIIAAVFIGEELYETGVVLLALRGQRD